MPLFSVIIPTFNRYQVLKDAIESVWQQTFTDYELIVVDDGSTDATAEFLASLGDRMRVLRQKNLGPGAARNLGAENATGEYLAFLDSDDLWFPWTLQNYAVAIEKNSKPAIISGKGSHGGTASIELSSEPSCRYWPCLMAACHDTMPPVGGTPSVAVRRVSFVDLGGFVAKKVNAEDVDLWFRFGVEAGFVRIESPPVFQQGYLDVTVSRDIDAQIGGIELVLSREKVGDYPGGCVYRHARERIIAAMARSVSFECLRAGRFSEAWEIYVKAMPVQIRSLRIRYITFFPLMLLMAKVRKKN